MYIYVYVYVYICTRQHTATHFTLSLPRLSPPYYCLPCSKALHTVMQMTRERSGGWGVENPLSPPPSSSRPLCLSLALSPPTHTITDSLNK